MTYDSLIKTFVAKRKSKSIKDAAILEEVLWKYVVTGRFIQTMEDQLKDPVMMTNHIGIVTNILRLLNGLLLPMANPQQTNG